jgi:hypothetical protein
VDAHDLTRGLVDVNGAAHAFLIVDTTESEISVKTTVGIVDGNDVWGKLPRRGYVCLNRGGDGVCDKVLDGAPFWHVVGEVSDDGATLPDGRDVEKTNVTREGNVVFALTHAKCVFSTASESDKNFFVWEVGQSEEYMGWKHEPASAEVKAPRPRHGILVGDGRERGTRRTDPDLDEFGVLEHQLTHNRRASLATTFPERGGLGAARTGTTAMLSGMSGAAFGLSRARTAGSVGVVRARLGLKLLVGRSGKENLKKLVETDAEDAGESEADAKGSEVGRELTRLKVFVSDLKPGRAWTTRRRRGRKL